MPAYPVRTLATGLVLAAALSGASTAPANAADSDSADSDVAGLVDIGGGRGMYLECRGTGSPTVVLLAGLKGSADDWKISDGPAPAVFGALAGITRVCAYDRPGTPVGDQPSRSDPAPQPTTAQDAVADLDALLRAAKEPGPYVLAGHSYGGLIANLYTRLHPEKVSGLVLIDAVSEVLQDAETPEQWAIQRVLMEGDVEESVALYPALERDDPNRSFDQLRNAPPPRPLPLIVLSADRPWGPQVAAMVADGTLSAAVPEDFGYVVDQAQHSSQTRLATLVPGARHITDTDSGHEIHKEQPQLVIDAIRDVLAAARAGRTRLVP